MKQDTRDKVDYSIAVIKEVIDELTAKITELNKDITTDEQLKEFRSLREMRDKLETTICK